MKILRLALLFFAVDLSAATITVTGTGDTIAVDGACTLREAITAANTNAVSGDCPAGTAGLDQIHFAIGGGGAQAINAFSPMPDIVEPVTINATTQPGFAGTPLITVFAAFIDTVPLFIVQPTGGGSTFRGLILRHSSGSAIELRSSGNVVAGNYFGTNGTTSDTVSGVGVHVLALGADAASNNVIGGVAAADRNIFGSFGGIGVAIGAGVGATADANSVIGNYFAWNPTKTAQLGALNEGVSIGRATNTSVTGNAFGPALISGVAISQATGTIVQSNEIGAIGAFSGAHSSGVRIEASNNSIIGAATSGGAGGNVIIGNGTINPEGAGVMVFGNGTGNRISGNQMSFNGSPPPGIGIDLYPYGATPNDACDSDTGPNLLQNKPVITSAVEVPSNGTVIIDGVLNSTASMTFTIEFYANPPGTGDQGFQYIGAVGTTTDAACNATFTSTIAFVPPADGWTITATAIDTANNTSEMSAPGILVELVAPVVTKQFNPATVAAGSATQLTITLTNPNAVAIAGTAFNDAYPAGLANAAVPNVTNSCGGTVTATPGGSSLTLSGGVIPASGSCSVSVFVVPNTEGPMVNTLPAGSVTSANAPSSGAPATATLIVSAAPAPAADVPLSPAALMLLAVALSMAGAMMLRQLSSGS